MPATGRDQTQGERPDEGVDKGWAGQARWARGMNIFKNNLTYEM